MLDERSIGFATHFFKAYPERTALMVGLMIVAGLAEGLGLVTLLPLIEMATGAGGGGESTLTQGVTRLLGVVGLAPSLSTLLGLIVVVMSAKGGLLWLAKRQVGYTVAQIATDLRLRLLRAVMEARWEYFVRQSSGEFANAVGTEALRASGAYRQACSAVANVIQVAVYLSVAFLVSWQVALSALAAGVGLLFVLRGFVTMTREAGSRQTALMKSLLGQLTEVLPGIKPMKAMARESSLLGMLEQDAREYNTAERKRIIALEFTRSFREPIFVLVIAVGLYATLAVGGMAFSTVSLLAILFYRLMMTIGELQTQYQKMTVGESALWSLQQRASEAEAAREHATGSQPAPALREAVTFEDVSFSYEKSAPDGTPASGGKRVPVLSGVSLSVPAGSFVAVTGPSGAGKTTLVDLVVGLLHPGEGRVLVDGVPMGQIDRIGWRRTIGYVPQKRLLFHTSIYRNVTLGDERIGREAVQGALEAAGAWRFVSRFEDGLDRVVGEQGARLSGGQGQRIMIARALVQKPRLLILDEATSALDPATEAAVCQTLRDLRGEVTILSVSHQAAMREAADLTYEVNKQKVRRLHPVSVPT